MNQKQLEERLINFAVQIMKISDMLPNNRSGSTIGNQLVRSGTSPALNYGEALGAESEKDFIHKLQIALKELRESFISLKIIKQSALLNRNEVIDNLINENNELISIFIATVNKIKNKSILKEK